MKVYRNGDLRKAKTDKIDSRIIANYGIEHWFTMAEFKTSGDVYGELKMLGQQYRHYMKLHIMSLHELTHLLDYMAVLIKNVSTYQKTKPVYDAYRKARNKEKYRVGQEAKSIS